MSQALPLVVIAGPTATGKTANALHIALALGGEIVGADSRQIYTEMDIGTAKPTQAERCTVPHHLIDVIPPDHALTLAEYQHMAYAAIDDIHTRGHLPLLAGGTGQYISAVIEGWGIPEVEPHPELRAEFEAFAEKHGAQALHDRLASLDPTAAARIDYRNVRRVVRALEVCTIAGRPISELQEKSPPPYNTHIFGLTMERDRLYKRVNSRVDRMVEAGLVAEVKSLAAHYGWDVPAMSGLGYRQIGAYLRGNCTLAEAIEAIKRKTRAYVRRQYTWFRKIEGLVWVDVEKVNKTNLTAQIQKLLAQ